jgi:hypothetical protein
MAAPLRVQSPIRRLNRERTARNIRASEAKGSVHRRVNCPTSPARRPRHKPFSNPSVTRDDYGTTQPGGQ